MQELTTRQSRVKEFLLSFIDEHGYPPTQREIAEGLEFKSPNSAFEYLQVLEKKGHIEQVRGGARQYRILGKFPDDKT